MSFVDKVQISVKAGKGGNGRRSFRRERFVNKGGPDGGDGGDGGDVIVRASLNQDTLSTFRYMKQVEAKDGEPGGTSRKHGKNGQSLTLDVPVGTEVSSEDNRLLVDLVSDGQETVIAKGGKGGFGNAHFVSSTRQSPNFAERGELGELLNLNLELKLIADIGLVGLPNAGKSTLLSRLSNARPEIADYPFTTITPNLGVADIDETTSLLIADIPGLIEGAAGGKGLGHEFLRHIERTKLIIHLIDIYADDLSTSYQTIRSELKAHSKHLAALPEVVVVNKIDGVSEATVKDKLKKLNKVLPKGTEVLTISAKAGTNLAELKYDLKTRLASLKPKKKRSTKPAITRITLEDRSAAFSVAKVDGGFMVSGEQVERFASRTNFAQEEAVDRLKSIFKRLGVTHELKRQGLGPGDQVYIGDDRSNSFEY